MKFYKSLIVIQMCAFLMFGIAASNATETTAVSIQDERIERFQSITLNGQVADTPYILKKVITGYSGKRLSLILFGDPSDHKVIAFRHNATKMLKRLAATGLDIALLHIDTSIYKEGTKSILENQDKTFTSPSALTYAGTFQATYHDALNDQEIDRIKAAILQLEDKHMNRVREL